MVRLTQLIFSFVTLALLSNAAVAQSSEQTTTARDRQSVNITVYNSNLGLVRETRRLTLPSGSIALRFADVTAQIRPETVHLTSLTAPSSLRILEQNYQYDLLNPAKLLDKFVGREITLVLRRYQNNTESFEPVQATLLSNNGGQVWRINGQIVINPTNISEMRFPDLPKNLVATPTLVWDVDNSDAAAQTVEASYLTNGMNWRADYVLLVNADDTKGDLQGWVTLTNASGATFEDARLQLVAGDVNRVTEEREYALAGAMAKNARMADEAQFQEQGFFEYHLYTLQRPTTIRDNETKQVSLLEAAGFDVKKEFVLNGQHYYYAGYNSPGQAVKEKIGVFIQFRNSQQNKLGMPLPAGTIRLYKKDDKGNQQFIGEDKIDHTPKDEDVRVKVGDAFDIVAERKQTDYKVIVSGHLYEYAYEIKIRNHKDTPVNVIVNEPIGGDWEMVSSTFEPKKTAAFAAQFTVPVAKDGETTLSYRVRVKY
ncbi:MAG TPA: DUF4139 domain-containing protein [Pyrinomonadaceae bacterium]|jgi:hypothetical protein|nr:DUF4139 domain-containing protein [Pyrinomonadaceae bacterium]